MLYSRLQITNGLLQFSDDYLILLLGIYQGLNVDVVVNVADHVTIGVADGAHLRKTESINNSFFERAVIIVNEFLDSRLLFVNQFLQGLQLDHFLLGVAGLAVSQFLLGPLTSL